LDNQDKDIEDCDIYTCGLAEFHDIGNVGETFATVIGDQYHRFRDGDRFWFEVDGYLSAADLADIKGSTLKDVIVRTTGIKDAELQCFVFAGPDGCGKAITAPAPGPTYSTYDWVVKLQKKTTAHPYFGRGHAYAFTFNGQEGPTLNMVRGKQYYVQATSSCAHALVFTLAPDINGTVLGPIPDGDDNEFEGTVHNLGCIDFNREMAVVLDYDTPDFFYYQCDFHDMLMGGNIMVTGPKEAPGSPASFVQPLLLLSLVALLALFL